jgi:hypothetical protein
LRGPMTAKLIVPLTVGAAIDASGTAIRATCPGHQITDIPWTMIEGGRDRTLAGIVNKLRCGKPPTEVHLHRPVSGRGNGLPTAAELSIGHLAWRQP